MNNKAIVEMKKYLGLPEKFNATFNNMFEVANRFEQMTGNDQEITAFQIVWWLDLYGNFTELKDPYSRIVNQIFMGMGKEMVQIFPFIELCGKKYKE